MYSHATETVLQAGVIEITNTYQVKCSIKYTAGGIFIDMRKWIVWPGFSDFRPTKKGIMLECNIWRKALPMIQQLLDDNTKV